MNSENDLMQKLLISKKIMERHDDIGRGNARNINNSQSYEKPLLEDFAAMPATYNIPQEFMEKPQAPVSESRMSGSLEDRVSKSKLPDEIKKLMLEHPITQPNMGSNTVLSDELVEKASRLMGTDAKGSPYRDDPQPTKKTQAQPQQNYGININEIKKVVRETVEEVLSENGLLMESESKSSDMFKFRVGQHLFEGKVMKVKKMSK